MIVINPMAPRSLARETMSTLSTAWWVSLVNGIIGLVAGGFILSIHWTVSDLAVFIGVFFVVRGIVTMTKLPLNDVARGWTIALGVLELALGLAVWVWPGPTLLVVAVFIEWWVLLSGTMTIVRSIAARQVLPFWGLPLAFGIAETVLAFWLLGQPGVTLVVAVFAIGLWSLVYGVRLLWRSRSRQCPNASTMH